MEEAEHRAARNIGVGCLTFVVGLFGGAMIAVLIAKVVGRATGCAAGPNGEPCNWYVYAGVGALTGALLLPTVALSKLIAGDRAARRAKLVDAQNSNRG